jgi:hypothetical protein
MFGFFKRKKNDYNRTMCGQAVAAAKAQLYAMDAMDEEVSYESFRHYVSQLKYHAQQARKYFKCVRWDLPTDEILANCDIETIETSARELALITQEEYEAPMDAEEEYSGMTDAEIDETVIETLNRISNGISEETTESTHGPCKKCGKITQSKCGCDDWICGDCTLGPHPEYPFIMCEECDARLNS